MFGCYFDFVFIGVDNIGFGVFEFGLVGNVFNVCSFD